MMDENWRKHAACRDANPRLFDPLDNVEVRRQGPHPTAHARIQAGGCCEVVGDTASQSQEGGSMSTCSKRGCDAEAKYGCRGMCEPDYRRTVRMGINGYVPAGPVREHVTKLRALGWTWEQIGVAAGVSTWVPYKAGTGHTQYLVKDRADAVLAVPLAPRDSQRGIDPTGTRRRVQALAWMGWPCELVAKRAGTTAGTLRTLILRGRRVSYSLARRVAAVYDELNMLPGPSRVTAGKARGMGFAPPLAWDDDTIDDPAAKPNLGDESARSAVELAEEAQFLLGFGMSRPAVAKQLKVSEAWLRQLLGGGKRAAA